MLDHEAVFASVYWALAPGGRFVAQCGGKGNLRTLFERADLLMAAPAFAVHAAGWSEERGRAHDDDAARARRVPFD